MKHFEILRQCADKLEREPRNSLTHDIIMVWPRGLGRFPFAGKNTEVLNATDEHTVYAVRIHRVLSGLSEALKGLPR